MEQCKLCRKSCLTLDSICATVFVFLSVYVQYSQSQSGTFGSGTDLTSNLRNNQPVGMERLSDKFSDFSGQSSKSFDQTSLKNTETRLSEKFPARNRGRWSSVPWQEEQLLPHPDTQGRSRSQNSENQTNQDRNHGNRKANLDKIIQEMSNKEQSLREGRQPTRSRTSTDQSRRLSNRRDSLYDTRDRHSGRTQDTRYRDRGDRYYTDRESNRGGVNPPKSWRDWQDTTPPARWRNRQDRRGPPPNTWDTRDQYPPTRPPPPRAGRGRNPRPSYPTHPPPDPNYAPQGQSSSRTSTGLHPLGLIDPDLPDGLDDRWQHMQAQKAWQIMNKEIGGNWRGVPNGPTGNDWKPTAPAYRGPTAPSWPNSRGGQQSSGQSSGRAQIWNSGSGGRNRNLNRASSGSSSPTDSNNGRSQWHQLREDITSTSTTASPNITKMKPPPASEFRGRHFRGLYPPTPPPIPRRGRGSINRWSEYVDMMHDYKQDQLKNRMRLSNHQRYLNNFNDRPDSLAEARQEAREDARQREDGRTSLQSNSQTRRGTGNQPRSQSGRRRQNPLLAETDRESKRYRPQPPVYDPSQPISANRTLGEGQSSFLESRWSRLPKLSDLDKSLQKILQDMNVSGIDPLKEVDNTLQSFLTGGANINVTQKNDASANSERIIHTYPPDQEHQENPTKFTELGKDGKAGGSPSLRFSSVASDTKTYIGEKQNNTNNSTKVYDPDNEGNSEPTGRSVWRNTEDRDPDPDAENTRLSGRQVWRNRGNNDADPDPDAEDSRGSRRQFWRTKTGQKHLMKEVIRGRIMERQHEFRRKLGEVEIEGGEIEVEGGGPLKHLLREMFRRKMIENYRRSKRLFPDPQAALDSLNATVRTLFYSMNNRDLQGTSITRDTPHSQIDSRVNAKPGTATENPGFIRTVTPPMVPRLPGDFRPPLHPSMYPELSDFHKNPTRIKPSPMTRLQPPYSSVGTQGIPSHLSRNRPQFHQTPRNSPIPHMETMWNSGSPPSNVNRPGIDSGSPISLNPLLQFPDTESTSPLPISTDKTKEPTPEPPITPFPKLTDKHGRQLPTTVSALKVTQTTPNTQTIPSLDTIWKTKEVPRSKPDIFDTLFDTPDEVVPMTTESIQKITGSRSPSNTSSKFVIHDDLFEHNEPSVKNRSNVKTSGSGPTVSHHATSVNKPVNVPPKLASTLSNSPAKIINSVTLKNNTHDIQTVTEKMVQVTEIANMAADVSTTSVFGIIAGIVIGSAVVLGPAICIMCRLRDRAKQKQRKRKAAAASRSKEENGIMEAIIMSELGRTPTTQGGATGGSCDGGARPKTRSNSSFAQTHYELQSLRSGLHSPTIIVH